MIGNLAERAAEQIGADALVARVISYYHDIGKIQSPTYFAENQARIANIHDSLPPAESARVIRQHVLDGLRLARQYHLPKVIQDGIAEHHGLNLVGYFYHQAVEQYPDQPINILEYTYPGPKPQSKETAILMLADGVEAAVRSVDTSDPQALAQVIHKVIFDRLLDGQLDECGLSMRDLTLIEHSFATVLQGLSHPRIKYPEQAGRGAQEPAEAKA
jgi:putative nucleotidyltransferase with HDIG domain